MVQGFHGYLSVKRRIREDTIFQHIGQLGVMLPPQYYFENALGSGPRMCYVSRSL